jgi:hypothetical protein
MGAKGRDYVALEFSWSTAALRMMHHYRDATIGNANPSAARQVHE